MHSSPRSSSGLSRASRTTRAPGSWPPRSIARSTRFAAASGSSASRRSSLVTSTSGRNRRVPDLDAAIDDDIGDDLLRLVFTTCHPVLSTEARVALTLRLLGGLTTEEIARAFLVPEPTVAQRIVRAKRTLAETHVPFEVPRRDELAERLSSVLEVIYLVFNEGYSATAGRRLDAPRALRGRPPPRPHPGRARSEEAEVHGLVALMEIQASRSRARIGPSGEPVLLLDQDRGRWDQLLIRRGLAALERAEELGGGLGTYALQAAIAACHARARTAGGDGLGAHRGSLRCARPARAIARGRAEPRGRGRDGVRSGSRSRARRCAELRAVAQELPPVAERARRSPREARPPRRGPRGVRARGVAHRNARVREMLLARAAECAHAAAS